jgi:hypothetical protein
VGSVPQACAGAGRPMSNLVDLRQHRWQRTLNANREAWAKLEADRAAGFWSYAEESLIQDCIRDYGMSREEAIAQLRAFGGL